MPRNEAVVDPTRRKWWIAGLSLAAVVVLALVAWRLTASGQLPRAVGDPAQIEHRLDDFAASDPYMLALKQYYPADYAELRGAMLADLREGHTLNEVQARAMERARVQADRRAAYVAAAPVEDLSAVIAAERAVVRRLQADDERLCAQFGMAGLPTGAHTTSQAAALLSRAAEARVKAARHGQEAPVEHAPPSAADLNALRAAMLKTGAETDLVALILSPNARQAPPHDQCAGSVAFYDALAALPPETAARWMSAITAQTARSNAAATPTGVKAQIEREG